MLKTERANNYFTWMDVGWDTFNIANGKDEGLQLWLDFSQKSNKFNRAECEDLWEDMQVRNKTLGSLLRMAKNDDP